jgi:hypothetical protein
MTFSRPFAISQRSALHHIHRRDGALPGFNLSLSSSDQMQIAHSLTAIRRMNTPLPDPFH